MTRAEYELLYSAFKSYRPFMTDAEEVMSEKILDEIFYPSFDALKNVSEPELPVVWKTTIRKTQKREHTRVLNKSV